MYTEKEIEVFNIIVDKNLELAKSNMEKNSKSKYFKKSSNYSINSSEIMVLLSSIHEYRENDFSKLLNLASREHIPFKNLLFDKIENKSDILMRMIFLYQDDEEITSTLEQLEGKRI